MANITLQINDETMSIIKTSALKNSKTDADFIVELIENALVNHHLLHSGGIILNIPNPQFYHINKEYALACINGIYEVSRACNYANIPNSLAGYADFLKARLFTDSQERKNLFKANLELRTSADSTQSDK